ncbi:hypothetical protein L6164_032571 [Bauhinia variegata]|uniref:Uncharacterized protein n=1 Tax=Bauhinia variegata TaxID=167791 RepID=A0ACB9KP01_BAUVA|nr:hypothetical protein L6164_032571 [Bauhinia variegata]
MELTGAINDDAFFNLEELDFFSLKNNSEVMLTGLIPEIDQPTLIRFNVSNNHLEGRIPNTRKLQSFEPDSFLGNPELCGQPSLNLCSTHADSPITEPGNQPDNNDIQKAKGSKRNFREINNTSHVSKIFNVVLVLLLAVVLLVYLNWNTTEKLNKMKGQIIPTAEDTESEEEKVEIGEGTVMAEEEGTSELVFFKDEPKFQMDEVLKASAEKLGQETIGNSYKAILNGGTPIVVKWLWHLKTMNKEDFKKLILLLIADLNHPNLLPLRAYYYSTDQKLLLYKDAENGNLFSRVSTSW